MTKTQVTMELTPLEVVNINAAITMRIYKLREGLDGLDRGDPIYDAMDKAAQSLFDFRKKLPAVKFSKNGLEF